MSGSRDTGVFSDQTGPPKKLGQIQIEPKQINFYYYFFQTDESFIEGMYYE